MLSRRIFIGGSLLAFVGGDLVASPIQQSAFRFYKGERTRLQPTTAEPTHSFSSSIIAQPGVYAYNDENFDLSQPGLYRFFNPMTDTTNRVVYGGDVMALLSAAAWWAAHGVSDNRTPGESVANYIVRMSARARTSKIRVQCTDLHLWAGKALLEPHGIQHRTTRFLTMGTTPDHLNGYDEGHVCFEVMIDGEWVLVDLTGDRLFHDEQGTRLNARDATAAIAADTWQPKMIALDGYAEEPAKTGRFDATSWAESFFLTPEDQRAWYSRIFQAVGIDRPNGETWWLLPDGAEERMAWVEGLSPLWKVKDAAAWNTTFYPTS